MSPEAIVTQNIKTPLVFDEFFELGLPESSSPFLTPTSRKWGVNLPLKAALLAGLLLIFSFYFSFNANLLPLSHLLLVAVYFLAGIPALIESIENIVDFEINIDVLMTLAAFSSILIGSGMEGGLLLVLFAVSGSMEDSVTAKAKDAISALHKLSPTKACVIDSDGTILERSIHDINVGATILVKSGEIVPLDGKVINGISSVNLVHLTGENLPVTKKMGDDVAAGAQNQEGALTLTVTHVSADSTLSRIIQLVTQAQEARPKLQRWFDKLSTRYATSIILFSFSFALMLPWLTSIPYLGTEGSIYRALAFLIAASPCALIIAIPIAYLSGVSVCARKGILLKGGITLDSLARCSIIAFDKTGTLTLGELECIGFESQEKQPNIDRNFSLAIAYAMEQNAVHPIAKAISAYAIKNNVTPILIQNFKSIPGYGLECTFESSIGKNISAQIGHPEYIGSLLTKVESEALLEKTLKFQEQGELLTVLKIENEISIFRFSDTPRPKIKEAIKLLKSQDWRLLMLTGDHETSAKKIANELGIDDYFANLRPEDKLRYVDQLSQNNGLVMIGDGVNDAPALARATVGICMGKVGSATAIAAADVILLHDNIELLGWLMNKARKTQRIVKQNLTLAIGAILIATIPSLAGYIPLWLAVVLHEGGTVLVGLNALRLLKKD